MTHTRFRRIDDAIVNAQRALRLRSGESGGTRLVRSVHEVAIAMIAAAPKRRPAISGVEIEFQPGRGYRVLYQGQSVLGERVVLCTYARTDHDLVALPARLTRCTAGVAAGVACEVARMIESDTCGGPYTVDARTYADRMLELLRIAL